MPQLFIKKRVQTIGEARDFLLMAAQEMNEGRTRGAGWSLQEKGDKSDDTKEDEKAPPAPSSDAPEAPEATQQGTASTMEPGKPEDEANMPWNKGKK